jgi:hypothetical protein
MFALSKEVKIYLFQRHNVPLKLKTEVIILDYLQIEKV